MCVTTRDASRHVILQRDTRVIFATHRASHPAFARLVVSLNRIESYKQDHSSSLDDDYRKDQFMRNRGKYIDRSEEHWLDPPRQLELLVDAIERSNK